MTQYTPRKYVNTAVEDIGFAMRLEMPKIGLAKHPTAGLTESWPNEPGEGRGFTERTREMVELDPGQDVTSG